MKVYSAATESFRPGNSAAGRTHHARTRSSCGSNARFVMREANEHLFVAGVRAQTLTEEAEPISHLK